MKPLKKLKILILTQFYPPLIGGEERFTRDLSRQLSARGHEVIVVTLLQDGLAQQEIDQGVKVVRIQGFTQLLDFLYSDTGRRAASPYPDPGLLLELRRIVQEEKPDIVHAHNWIVHSFVPLKAWSGAKLVLTLHDFSLVCAKKKLLIGDEVCSGAGLSKCFACSADHYGAAKGIPTALFNWFSCALERHLVDAFVPVSHAVAVGNDLIKHGLPYEVIPNFVPDDVGRVPPVDDEVLRQLPDEPFLLFVGAFGRYKGVDLLLESYQRLSSPPPLVLIGYETSEYPIATKDMPPGVTVLRNWKHAAVMAAWQRCLIGITPSMWIEPCATTPMEAMAVGKPVIATRIGGFTDIVKDGETGLLVTPGDVDGLTNAIARLLANPEERAALGSAGREHVRNFQASTVIPRYEALYTRLLNGDPVVAR